MLSDRFDELMRREKKLGQRYVPLVPESGYRRYVRDPVGYARDVLRVGLTPDQCRIAESMLRPPYRVLVNSSHNIGKSFLAAVLVNYWYDTRNPGIAITTAPTKRDVVDIIWSEVRLQRQRVGLPAPFIGPAAPEMLDTQEHYAKGFTSSTGESFQGRHRPNMLFVFDEAEGIDGMYWKTTNTMFQPDGTCAWLAIENPTTTTSQSYIEEKTTDSEGNPKWQVYSISALDHPNIVAQLAGKPPPIPSAVTLEQVQGWLGDWFESVQEHDLDTDIEFPPGSGAWYRPDPDGESRVLGRRPSAGTFGIWSEAAWRRCIDRHPLPFLTVDPRRGGNLNTLYTLPELGCDVARYGHDKSAIHTRHGPCSISHEEHSGWDTVRVAGRCQDLAVELAAHLNRLKASHVEPTKPKQIPLKVDDCGVGGGVTDILQANGFNAQPINAGSSSALPERYYRLRDELWFALRARAKAGMLDLTRLPKKVLANLERQALSPMWYPMPNGTRRVEEKEQLRKRLGRSPDGMDAVNLAYLEPRFAEQPKIIQGRDLQGSIMGGRR